MNTRQLKLAQKIIDDYRVVIELADPSLHGIPDNLLKYSKAQIKQALMTALGHLEPDEVDLRESLVQALLYLAQFVPEKEAEIARRGQLAIASGNIRHPDFEMGEPAMKIINQIKAEMEDLKQEAVSYMIRKQKERDATQ